MTDPIEQTQPHPTGDGDGGERAGAAAGGGAAAGADAEAGGPAAAGVAAANPPLRADPDRPADSGWREPAWFPPGDRRRHRDRGPSAMAIVIGLVLIAAGAYAFADQTLGIALPTVEWSGLWPLILIAVGGWILLRSLQRR